MPDWAISSGMWNAIFGLGAPLAEKILRPAIVYVFLVVFLRVFGKRELAQLNPFDLVVLLSLSNTVQNAIIGDDNSVTGGLDVENVVEQDRAEHKSLGVYVGGKTLFNRTDRWHGVDYLR